VTQSQIAKSVGYTQTTPLISQQALLLICYLFNRKVSKSWALFSVLCCLKEVLDTDLHGYLERFWVLSKVLKLSHLFTEVWQVGKVQSETPLKKLADVVALYLVWVDSCWRVCIRAFLDY
jgi:hypothetical protein